MSWGGRTGQGSVTGGRPSCKECVVTGGPEVVGLGEGSLHRNRKEAYTTRARGEG